MATKAISDKLWEGDEQIILGVDIGTTQCAVSYSYLFPGGPQTVQRVLQWPGQGAQKGEAKIPSLIWYDQTGQSRAFGAEAIAPELRETALDETWELAEHFKIHLHPRTIRAHLSPKPLPHNKTVEEIYADLLRYLCKHAEDFFVDHEIKGKSIWERLRNDAVYVIAHPNGWGIHEQAALRRAAVRSGIVAQDDADTKVQFVSEGEASVHFVAFHSDLETRMKPGQHFVVCDAGGSTVDTTAYVVKQTSPTLELEETKASACIQAGAIFVNHQAEAYFKQIFRDADYDEEDIKEFTHQAVESFESRKRAFVSSDDEMMIEVGGHRLSDPAIGIRRGIKKLPGTLVDGFFRKHVDQIIESLTEQMSGHHIDHVLLVGGFGDSPYLRRKLQEGPCASQTINLTLATDSTAKAVADGSVIFHIKQAVAGRVPRYAFGIPVSTLFNPANPRHHGRTIVRDRAGAWVPGVWGVIARKDQVVQNGQDISKEFSQHFFKRDANLEIESDIYVWTGEGLQGPYFIHDDDFDLVPGFKRICTVKADLSGIREELVEEPTFQGQSWWWTDFRIGFKFGAVELKAFIIWQEKGIERRAPATIVPYRLV
jgi:uncharacterized protein YfcZ (UPF0381/DUF406 family)